MAKPEKKARELIDKKLRLAGWNLDDKSQVAQEFRINLTGTEEFPKSSYPDSVQEAPVSDTSLNKPDNFWNAPFDNDNSCSYTSMTEGTDRAQKTTKKTGLYEQADYVLFGKNGKPLAVVEAKKADLSPKAGREQAKQYCYNIQKEYGGELPFCFFSNGDTIEFWNLENAPSQKVAGFPTRDELERYRYIRKHKKSLSKALINQEIAGRDYQIQAIRTVAEGIEKKRRKFLLVMATGTGKTRTCIALVDLLRKANRAERILFLVDRIALREQTLNAFKEHLPDEPRWPQPLETLIKKDRRIYVSTYQSMLPLIRDQKSPLSPHFFDLVVADESHRSIYNVYGEILSYFHATCLGLTATPTDAIDHNTFKLFGCEDGVPTFAFSYEEALNHKPPYLSPFEVLRMETKFQDDGINKRTITLEDQKRLLFEGKDVEEINYEGTDLEKKVINRNTNVVILREFMEECIKDHNGVLPGKTIIFCVSKDHARRMEEIFNDLYPEHSGELARTIVSDESRVHGKGGLIDQFTNEDMPRIAISVDMLDTGIDVREITNLLFAKPVYSYTKFWQMIGRGTRLLDEKKRKPWCTKKEKFLILDCWNNFEYFKLDPKGKEPANQIPLPVKLFEIRIDKIEKSIEYAKTAIAEKEVRQVQLQIEQLPNESIVIRDASRVLRKVKQKEFWSDLKAKEFKFLREKIQPLFRTVSQSDFKAMRFERDVLVYSLALLIRDKEKLKTLQKKLIEQIAELPLSINTVAKESELIIKAQTNHYWQNVTDSDLDELIKRLAPLMKFREPEQQGSGVARYDLKDIVKNKEFVEFGPEHESMSTTKYREMVEQRILNMVNENPILQKLKSGAEISENETEELAELLYKEKPQITEELLRKVYQNQRAKFIQLIRHILGLETLQSFPETVSQAIQQFIQDHTNLDTRQLNFLTLLEEFIIERETVQKRDLIQSPFTTIHPNGIRGVFSAREIEELLKLTEHLAA